MTAGNDLRPFRFTSLEKSCIPVENIWPPKQANIRADVWAVSAEALPDLPSTTPEEFFLDIENGRMKTAPYRVAYLENVRFNARTGVLFPETDVVLGESWYAERWFRLAIRGKLYPLTDMFLATVNGLESLSYLDEPTYEVISAPCFLLCHNPAIYSDNYAHWLLDILPRFSALEKFPDLKKIKILLHPELTPLQEESLALFGISQKNREVFKGRVLQLAKVFVPTYPASGGYSRHQVEWLGATLPRLMGLSPKSPHRRLYISREDAFQRRVSNHSEVRGMLEAKGFETIIPGRMTLRQQVEIFSEAECVISPHGAACANIVFCPSGAKLIEFLPEKYLHPMYGILAHLRGMNYHRLICPADTLTSDMAVDLPAVEKLLEDLKI